MAIKYGRKKVCGRYVDTFIIDTFKKKVKKVGTSGHVMVSRKYALQERYAEINILSLKPFLCERCADIYSEEKHFSPNPKLCSRCYLAKEFLKKNRNKLRCEKCNIKITEKEYETAWDRNVCPGCWEEEAEKFDEENNGSIEDFKAEEIIP